MSNSTDKNINKNQYDNHASSKQSAQTSVINNQNHTDLELKEKQNQELRKKVLQLMAEMDNLQKRHYHDLEKSKHTAIKNFALDMCSVLEDINLALQVAQDYDKSKEDTIQNSQWQNMLQGLVFIKKNTLNTLKKYHIQPINTDKNSVFDPRMHEAVQKIHHSTCSAGNICHTVRNGYMLNNQVLSPAQVIISLGVKTKSQEQ